MTRARGWFAGAVTIAALAFGGPAHAAKGQSLALTTGLSTYYDSNILQYSDGQITEFEGGRRPLHFSIKSRDDLVFNPTVALLWELDEGHGRRHSVRLKGEGDFHDKNGTADFRSLSAQWRESFRHERRFSLGYYVLPQYYLRQLIDEELPPGTLPTRHRRATFKLQIATAGWDQRLTKNTDLALAYQFEGRDYNSDFKERTSKLHQGEVGLGWNHLPRHSSVSFRGGYRVSIADAADGDEVGGAADDQDVSYHGFVDGLSGRTDLVRREAWRLVGDIGYDFETRHFLSDRAFDTSHKGRDDVLNAVEVGLRAVYRPHWSARGFYRYENNHASFNSATPPATDPGSYKVNQVGVALEWTGEIWAQVKGAGPAGGAGKE